MLGVVVEGIGSSLTTTTATTTPTFPVLGGASSSVATTPISITTAAPGIVAGGGVGLIPLVAAASAAAVVDPTDPRSSLLMPVVTALGGSNSSGSPLTNGSSGPTAINNNNNNSSSINSNNPAAMEEEFVKPILKDGEMILEVECGQNKAGMYLSKLCQGSKGPCINFQGSWLTPNEFQFVSGRETAKDWKRSIRHHGKSLKLLLAKGILSVHPTMCDCEGCRIGAVLTRKGEKRRIPNGERKRKSTGNAPENPGNGAFRALPNGVAAVRTQDGPSDPKRPALDMTQEGKPAGQSPLRESSLMNLPESRDVSALRMPEGHVADVSKMAVDSRLQGPAPLLPLLSPDHGSINRNGLTSARTEHKDALQQRRGDKIRHSSAGSSHSDSSSICSNSSICSSSSASAAVAGVRVTDTVAAAAADVKVLSSSSTGGGAGDKVDRSMDRLALYQAAVSAVAVKADASPRGGDVSMNDDDFDSAPSSPGSDDNNATDENHQPLVGVGAGPSAGDTADLQSPPVRDVKDFSFSLTNGSDVKAVPVFSSSPALSLSAERKDLKTEGSITTSPAAHPAGNDHSTVTPFWPFQPGHGSSLSPAKPLLSPIVAAAATTTTTLSSSSSSSSSSSLPAAPHNTKPNNNPHVSSAARGTGADRADRQQHQPQPASAVASLPSPHAIRPTLDNGEHFTIRHPSPERRSSGDNNNTAIKHSPVGKSSSSKDHHHHHNSAEKSHNKDRKQDSSSTSSASDHKDRDRHRERESSSSSSSARHNSVNHHDRDADRRRQEERSSDKDRKSVSSSGPSMSSKAEEPSFRPAEYPGVAGGRVEGVPSVAGPMQAPVADPAAFSEYMRLLAAGHHGLVPQPGLPPMFSLRGPGDVPVSSGLMHPMHAAACGMFSTPAALLPKDPALYQAAMGGMPAASYPYGAPPGLAPIHLMPQLQSANPAAAAAMLDYSRGFPSYMSWPGAGGMPLMMPADSMAAAAAAAAMAASQNAASAKRSREEMESAASEVHKRFPGMNPMAAAYGVAGAGGIPLEYMAAYRGLSTAGPMAHGGMESSLYDKNAVAEYMRKRMYADLPPAAQPGPGSGGSPKGMDSPYLASLPYHYRNFYCCPCMENRPGDIRTWGVEDVAKLVSSLEGCSVYTEIFREQRVDGKILVLLNTEHLMKNLGMKLGPALALTNRVAKLLLESTRASGCERCSRLAYLIPSVQQSTGGY